MKYIALVLLFGSLPFTCLSQKSFKLYKRGNLRAAEQYSLRQVKAYQLDATKRLGKIARYKRIAPYHTLGLIERTRGNFRGAFQYFDRADSALNSFANYKRDAVWAANGTLRRKGFWRYSERNVERARIQLSLGNFEEAKKVWMA